MLGEAQLESLKHILHASHVVRGDRVTRRPIVTRGVAAIKPLPRNCGGTASSPESNPFGGSFGPERGSFAETVGQLSHSKP
jgi:hypothetical protein